MNNLNGGLLLLVFALIAGCSMTTTATSTTLASLATVAVTQTTTVAAAPAVVGVEGYVVTVLNGHTFDLQANQDVTRLTLGDISVPDIGTCEGTEARGLLASIIAGKKVRVDGEGVLWREDIDVSRAMVQYGRAKASTTKYVSEDMASVDFDCASTTTTALPVIVVAPPPKPRQTRPTVAVTDPPVETEVPVVTEPTPVAEPEPRETKPDKTDPPETKPDKTDPPPVETVDVTPRTPKTPETPKLPGEDE